MNQSQVAPAGSSPAAGEYPVRFLGTGGEYFRIWIVNLLLTIVTLGIYSAWAKVRRLKYMYRNTQIAGSSFDYHGSPVAILIGRLIALVLLIAYNFSFQFSLVAGLITLALLAAIFPWLIRQSLRFRARYSSYRGVHFHFVGGLTEIYLIAAPVILVVIPVALLGLYGREDEAEPPLVLVGLFALAMFVYVVLLPYLHYRFKRYQHNNALLGSTQARFTGRAAHFYAVYGILLAGLIGFLAVFAAIGFAAGFRARSGPETSVFGVGLVLMVVLLYLGYLLLLAAFVALIQNRVWNNTTLGEVSFRSNVRVMSLAGIYLVNVLLLILTIGLFTPFAVIRTLRYRLQSVTALSSIGMDQFLAQASTERVGATGEGAADLFDFDIGL